MDDLPTDYDVIVIGTGMTGAIVAGAVSRVGKTVLHIDENDYYGEEWASFSAESILTWLDSQCTQSSLRQLEEKFKCDSSETLVEINRKKKILNPNYRWNCPSVAEVDPCKIHLIPIESGSGDDKLENPVTTDSSQPKEEAEEENRKKVATSGEAGWTREKFKQESRKFNLDLSPRMLYSRGSLVELLISSNIARYAEFKTVSRVLTWRGGRLEVVPCSRADVFATKHVSIVQKRMLVKMLSSFADFPTNQEEFEAFKDGTFVEYLKHKKIDDQLIHYIVYAIAMGSMSTPCLVGVENCKKFLQSLGRYGNTPFIFPLYGSGEIPQCFCRLCAVFGGIYHLKRPITDLITNAEGSAVGIVSAGKRLNAKTAVVMTSLMCPERFIQTKLSSRSVIYRAIFITNKSIADAEKEAVTLLQFPPGHSDDPTVTVMEMGPASQVCPPGLFVVHMTAEILDENREKIMANWECLKTDKVFDHVENALFQTTDNSSDTRPRILWRLCWEMPFEDFSQSELCPKNLRIFPGPDSSIDYEYSLKKAHEIFKDIYPDEEFLPRAPDSDEIVLDYPDQPDEPQEKEKAEETKTSDDNEDGEETSAPHESTCNDDYLGDTDQD